jgi:cysteinyl-tRNA synthetase
LLWGTAAGRIVNCVEADLRLSDEGTAWWPSPFGDHDQIGMLNHITDATRAAALRLVTATGRSAPLQHGRGPAERQRRRRSTHTRSRWTGATASPIVSGGEMSPVQLYNTRTRVKETFVPADPSGRVGLFVCGPTVYDLPHLGHATTYTQFDFLARLLRARGFAVTYVQNITDVDDKIIRRARERGVDPSDLARRYERAYLNDMRALRNDSVDVYARASDYVGEVVSQIERLQAAGAAYATADGIYFDLTAFPDYGRLSGRTNALGGDSVSRLAANPHKRNAGDFVLWKARRPGEPFWESELGDGRPGWHIEDTAISERLLAAQYDLHGGAIDLIFPHHEAEIAQMETISGLRPMVAYWMHTGLLTTGDAKMSKSVGNLVTIRDALAAASARAIRFAFLSSHYRSPMELTDDTFPRAARALDRLDRFVEGHDPDAHLGRVSDARAAIDAALDDDIDTPRALAVLFDLVRERAGPNWPRTASFSRTPLPAYAGGGAIVQPKEGP